jgi:dynein heavy chain
MPVRVPAVRSLAYTSIVVRVSRFHVQDEVFEMARKAYEWPKRFGEVLREGSNKAGAERRQFEAALKVRRKEFEQQIEQFVAKLAVVEGRSDIVKREVAVAEVSPHHGFSKSSRACCTMQPC